MKSRRVLLTLMLSVLMIASACVPASAFSSEPKSWAKEQCSHLENDGLLNWDIYTKSIAPTDAIKRGDFCQLLVNLVQMEGDWNKIQALKPAEAGYFKDLNDLYSGSGYAMHYGVAYGITEGSLTNDGRRIADANSLLTREQAAKMMCALTDALENYGGVPAPKEGAGAVYTDQAKIAGWAKEYVDRASKLGILKGNANGTFNPKGTLTWQEACVMVDRAYSAAQESAAARKAKQGISLNQTALDVSAAHYLTGSESLYALENNGRHSVLSIGSEAIKLETYNADGTSAGIKTIPMELSRCGGFYESDDFYYLAFGQNNTEESSSKTVFRIVKYDKNWNRKGAADINDCYTSEPFRHTSHIGMAEEDGVLVFHTARLRYLTKDDGLRHQSNFTAKIRTSDMSVTEQSAQFPDNHVSHSFAQYVMFDNGMPVYIDHGDAYPRGFTLNAENAQGSSREMNFFPFYGAIGDNTTNAVPGGMGVAANNYLFLGASSPQKGNDSLKNANVFLSVIPKSSGQAKTKWLTSFPADGQEYVNNLQLVQINNNTFVAMWQTTKPGRNFYNYGDFTYAVFDGEGNQIGKTQTLQNYIAPGSDVSVYGSRIIWAQPELDVSQRYTVRKSRYMQIFELEIDANGEVAVKDPVQTEDPNDSNNPQNPNDPAAGDPGNSGNSGSSDIPRDTSYPVKSESVNGRDFVRTNVGDGESTRYYREDWGNGNFMQVKIDGNTVEYSVKRSDYQHTRGILAANGISRNEFFITPGKAATATAEINISELKDSEKTHNLVVGTAAAGESYYSTFMTGVGLRLGLDENGEPVFYADLPSWLK